MGAACAEVAFAVGGEAGVVADVDGAVEPALEFGAEVEAVEAGEIGRMVQNAEGQFDGAGAADADAEEVASLLVDELANGGGHVVENGVGTRVKAGGKTAGGRVVRLQV